MNIKKLFAIIATNSTVIANSPPYYGPTRGHDGLEKDANVRSTKRSNDKSPPEYNIFVTTTKAQPSPTKYGVINASGYWATRTSTYNDYGAVVNPQGYGRGDSLSYTDSRENTCDTGDDPPLISVRLYYDEHCRVQSVRREGDRVNYDEQILRLDGIRRSSRRNNRDKCVNINRGISSFSLKYVFGDLHSNSCRLYVYDNEDCQSGRSFDSVGVRDHWEQCFNTYRGSQHAQSMRFICA